MKHLVLLLACPLPLWADGCPTAPDHGAELAALIARAQSAQTEAEGRALSDQMWDLWDNAPDAPSQAMLDQGMRARGSFDFAGAYERFNALVNYCPFYAEGYNQRAFVSYLRQDYAAALPDLERALALNPDHVGALSGKALTLMALQRPAEALDALDAALARNPWLGERHMRPALLEQLPEL